MPTPPAIQYVRSSDGVDIAYWRLGRGPVLLHSANVQLGHLRSEWSVEAMRSWYESLARSFTVVRYDHRGGGLSSRSGLPQSIDSLVRDIESVAREVSTDSFILFGFLTGGLPAVAYASHRPERVSHLVLFNSFERGVDLPKDRRLRSLFEMAGTDWELFTESIAQAALGWRDADVARRWASVARDATTQAEFLDFLEIRRSWDISRDLGRVSIPTLVMHTPDNALASEEASRRLAASIPGARLVECRTERGAPGSEALALLHSFVNSSDVDTSRVEGLTRREREVLELVVDGATNAEIAERLFISGNTVARHLTHIYRKTGTRRRAHLVRFALERGLSSL